MIRPEVVRKRLEKLKEFPETVSPGTIILWEFPRCTGSKVPT